jgi:hypothetical protein
MSFQAQGPTVESFADDPLESPRLWIYRSTLTVVGNESDDLADLILGTAAAIVSLRSSFDVIVCDLPCHNPSGTSRPCWVPCSTFSLLRHTDVFVREGTHK